MIKPEKLNGILLQITEELRNAEAKHPKFCDKMTTCVNADFMKKSELLYKNVNSKPPYSAENILEEEIREALSSYLEGDRIHTLEELAQCGAVIIRMMDFVSKEIEMKSLTKYEFNVCEAVHLGLDYYYMAKNDRRKLTKEDYELAKRILPTLPEGWYRERHEWDASKW